tara:strand:+ start:8094 stop:8435 length:342 start_codon:yes stop_codon:yes gene_type:complete
MKRLSKKQIQARLKAKQNLELAKKKHRQFLLSVGLPIDKRNRVIIKARRGYDFPDLSTEENYKLSNNISGIGKKRWSPSEPYIPKGKTVGIGYNKGTYQLVDGPDIKTMGRKV